MFLRSFSRYTTIHVDFKTKFLRKHFHYQKMSSALYFTICRKPRTIIIRDMFHWKRYCHIFCAYLGLQDQWQSFSYRHIHGQFYLTFVILSRTNGHILSNTSTRSQRTKIGVFMNAKWNMEALDGPNECNQYSLSISISVDFLENVVNKDPKINKNDWPSRNFIWPEGSG